MATLYYAGREIITDDQAASQALAHSMRASNDGRTALVLLNSGGATDPIALAVGPGIALGVRFDGPTPRVVTDIASLV